MKKLLTFLTALLCFSAAWAYDVKVDGIYYNLNKSDNTASVVAGDNVYSGNIVIPETISVEGATYSVTSIGDESFRNCIDLVSVSIPSSVTSLGENSFRYCGLMSISLPNSITSIGNSCFYYCEYLTSIVIPNSVTSLGDDCFRCCYWLESVTLSNSLTSMGVSCFEYCIRLKSITIPRSVTSIGVDCFCRCKGLESIVVEDGNSVYDSREGCNAIVETSTNTMLVGCKNTMIPNSITSLADNCFDCCAGLTSITIPNSVTSLGYECFHETGLTTVTIPNSVTSIGSLCFYDCAQLTNVRVDRDVPPSTKNDILDGCLVLNTIYVPVGATANYNRDPWRAYNIVEDETLAVDEIVDENTAPAVDGYYDLNGNRLSEKQPGVNIIRYTDGSYRKVIVR
ncbi:MAG: leucine-rich repeat domain-containing protein [Lepagella sp.]